MDILNQLSYLRLISAIRNDNNRKTKHYNTTQKVTTKKLNILYKSPLSSLVNNLIYKQVVEWNPNYIAKQNVITDKRAHADSLKHICMGVTSRQPHP